MSEIGIAVIDLDPKRPWLSLTRYSAFSHPGVCFVRWDPDSDEFAKYTQASYFVPETHPRFPDLHCGLFVSIQYHHGRSCYVLERQYTAAHGTREQEGETSWFLDFEDALASLLERPYSTGSDKLRSLHIASTTRFTGKIKVSSTGCWEWTASTRDGYGLFWFNGKNHQAHRISYEYYYGPIPADLEIDHARCQNRKCVNPEHLEAVTHAENVRRGDAGLHMRTVRNQKHCNRGHEYSEWNLYTEPNGCKRCRECGRENVRRYREMKKI